VRHSTGHQLGLPRSRRRVAAGRRWPTRGAGSGVRPRSPNARPPQRRACLADITLQNERGPTRTTTGSGPLKMIARQDVTASHRRGASGASPESYQPDQRRGGDERRLRHAHPLLQQES
jgi:hypothetical protein